jgi:drug/metabolite transporter (DMT)-like permease
LLGVLLLDTLGQLALKGAADQGDLDFLARWRQMLTDIRLWIGVSTYVLEFFFWLAFLACVPLSQGVLVGSINILSVMIGGRILYKEALTRKRVIGCCLIAFGVALVGWA